MITLHLMRGEINEGVVLPLPTTPAQIAEAYSWLDTICDDEQATKIFDVVCPVKNLGKYIMDANPSNSDDMAKLDSLAIAISEMDKQQMAVFSGALDAESINGLDDVLNVAHSLDQYILLHGVSNNRELGAFLVDSGYKSFPESVRPYLDLAAIGEEYYADRGGAFTSAGYVQKRVHAFTQSHKSGAVFNLMLTTGQGKSVHLELPALEEELDQAKKWLGIEEFSECTIQNRIDHIAYAADLIPNDCITVEVANEMALGIDEMRIRDGELMKFFSVLEVEQPETFDKAFELAMNLDDYERVPADPAEYGEVVLYRIGADDEVLDAIDGFMDFKGFGEFFMKEDGVRTTEFGLVRRCSEPFPEPDNGPKMV